MLAQIDGDKPDVINNIKSVFNTHYIKISNEIEIQSLENNLKIWISNEIPENYHVWCKDANYQNIEQEKKEAENLINSTSLVCIVSKHSNFAGSRHLVFTGDNHFKSLHNDYDLIKYLVNFVNGYNF